MPFRIAIGAMIVTGLVAATVSAFHIYQRLRINGDEFDSFIVTSSGAWSILGGLTSVLLLICGFLLLIQPDFRPLFRMACEALGIGPFALLYLSFLLMFLGLTFYTCCDTVAYLRLGHFSKAFSNLMLIALCIGMSGIFGWLLTDELVDVVELRDKLIFTIPLIPVVPGFVYGFVKQPDYVLAYLSEEE